MNGWLAAAYAAFAVLLAGYIARLLLLERRLRRERRRLGDPAPPDEGA